MSSTDVGSAGSMEMGELSTIDMALEELEKFRAKSEFYSKYTPLTDAIESLRDN